MDRFFNRLCVSALDQGGAASALLVASLPMFVLIAGLAIDSGGAFSEQTVLQSTANSAALAAGLDLRTHMSAQIVSDAQSYASKNLPSAQNGTVLASSDVKVGKWDFSCAARDGTCFTECQTMTDPITCSNPNGLTINAVRALVRRSTVNKNPFPTAFLALAQRSAWNVSALAIAAIGPNGGVCFLSTTSVSMGNNGSITTNGCDAQFDGTLHASQNAGTDSVQGTNGGVVLFGPAGTNPDGIPISPTAINNAPIPNDPYANTPVPACNAAMTTSTLSSATPAGSCIVGAVSIGQNVTINLQPGFYVFNAATVTAGNALTINGTGVTLFMTNNSKIGTGNTATFNITAPASGQYQGIALFGVGAETIAPAGAGNGNGNPCGAPNNSVFLNVVGAIYLPGGTMCLKNGTVGSNNSCTPFVIGTLTVKNNLTVTEGDNCSGAGTFAIGHARLVL